MNRGLFKRAKEIENYGIWKKIWLEYKRGRRFENGEMEKLYQRYVLQANMIHLIHVLGLLISSFMVMFLGLVLIYIMTSTVSDEPALSIITMTAVFLSIIMFAVLLGVLVFQRISETLLLHISYVITAVFMVLEITIPVSKPTASLWATVFFVYINYALLPVRLLEATLAGISLSIVHIPPFENRIIHYPKRTTSINEDVDKVINGITINLLILLAVNLVGILIHFSADMAKRKAFFEIRHFVRTNVSIQKETVRQQTLLMSVLPEHLIEEMKSDLAQLGGSISKRKIYMKAYDPVSILFADIVGFTALADCSAGSFVVELLNDLYCNFDKLAKNNRCMRIKLLGDCYYCVCGLPKPDNFHASHCVQMGLDMIHTTHVVRERYKINVDIRVGIHTGKLQCGVLGLKKWQFDIWGSDVEIANNMESAGLPGKVHISEATRKHLASMKDQYEIVPAHGSSRDPSLKDMETYFVTPSREAKFSFAEVKTLGPSSSSNTKLNTVDESERDPIVPLFNLLKRERDIERDLIAALYNSINSRSFRQMKKANCKSTVLLFKNKHMERKYNQEPDQMLKMYFITALVVFLSVVIIEFIVIQRAQSSESEPHAKTLRLCFAVGAIWFLLVCLIVTNSKCLPKIFHQISKKLDESRNLAQLLALVTVVVSYIVITIPMSSEDAYFSCRSNSDIEQAESKSLTPIRVIHDGVNGTCSQKTLPYPEHPLLYTILIMIMTGAFQIVMFRYKFMIMLVICSSYATLLIADRNFLRSNVPTENAIKYFLTIMALTSFLLLIMIQSQQSEIVHRLDFVWKINARNDTENVKELQKFNTRLIENILPVHVAKHYLDMDRRTEELYHEECLSTCILFAYITRFSFTDVTGENSERNVAILNDIISDIDELLNEPLFYSIEKIKCTGAIYMAASGLSMTPDTANSKEHVLAMAYFALSLQKLVQRINTRHNTSFGVKIGICMGSVVAGVIGDSVPQYDIWGNTVNVASRMYSTGLENHIQVTETVALLLQENGFTVKKRGDVFVKGKGMMVTYFLQDGPNLEEALREARIYRRTQPPDGLWNYQGGRRSRKHSKNEDGRTATDSSFQNIRNPFYKLFKGAKENPGGSEVSVSKNLGSKILLSKSEHTGTQTLQTNKISQPASSRPDTSTSFTKNSLNKNENLQPPNNKNVQPTPGTSQQLDNELIRASKTLLKRVGFPLGSANTQTSSKNSENPKVVAQETSKNSENPKVVAQETSNNSLKQRIKNWKKRGPNNAVENTNHGQEQKNLQFWKKQNKPSKSMKRVSFSVNNDSVPSSSQQSKNVQKTSVKKTSSRIEQRRVEGGTDNQETHISPSESETNQSIWRCWKRTNTRTED